MDQWTFVAAAFGITGIVIGGYIATLRGRLRAAEADLRRLTSAASVRNDGDAEDVEVDQRAGGAG